MSGLTLKFRLSLLITLAGACLGSAFAEEAANRITAISVDPNGQLILTVEGEGVDPIVRLEPAPNQQYRIIIQGQGALLNPSLVQDSATVSALIRQHIPAVEAAQFSSNNQETEQFQLVLTSWQKLQPQIKSNTGSKIVIVLVGNHMLPPAVEAKRNQEAELKRQAELKKQAEAEATRKAEEQRKQQAELQRKQAEQAALKRKQLEEEAANKQEAQRQLIESQKRAAAEAAKKLGEQKQKQAKIPASAHKSAAQKPLQSVSSEQLQSDWVTAYRPQSPAIPDEPLAQLQLVQSTPKPFTPKMLALDKIPPPSPVLPDLSMEPDDTPTEPIRLSAPPSGLLQDQGNFDWEPGKLFVPQIGTTSSQESIYAVINNPNANTAIRKAWNELQSGNATSAEMGLRSYLEKSPDDTHARYLLAQVLLRPATEALATTPSADIQARREAARQELLKIVSKTPHLPAYLALIDLYLEDENHHDADRLLIKVSQVYPDHAGLLVRKGRIKEGLNAPDSAREAYLQALGKEPTLLEAHLHLAQIELNAKRLDAARWELAQGLAIAPSDARLWKLLGFVAEKQNEPQKAGQFYRQALQPDALINYARSLEAQNQPEKALTIYQAVETLAGDDIDILYNLGMIYASLRQGARAEVALGRFLELNKNTQDSRIGQARTTLKQLGHKPGKRSGTQPKILPF